MLLAKFITSRVGRLFLSLPFWLLFFGVCWMAYDYLSQIDKALTDSTALTLFAVLGGFVGIWLLWVNSRHGHTRLYIFPFPISINTLLELLLLCLAIGVPLYQFDELRKLLEVNQSFKDILFQIYISVLIIGVAFYALYRILLRVAKKRSLYQSDELEVY